MFEHGTCLILMEPQKDLQDQAKKIMEKWGPVVPGSPAGDFTVSKLQDYPGWVVYYHHPDMISYVSPDELEEDDDESNDPLGLDVIVGYIGRNKRHEDAKSLNIVHIEDKRSPY
ncbi:MAG: hypothetical protein ACFFD2_03620 [Promethearchaeota archaeon]